MGKEEKFNQAQAIFEEVFNQAFKRDKVELSEEVVLEVAKIIERDGRKKKKISRKYLKKVFYILVEEGIISLDLLVSGDETRVFEDVFYRTVALDGEIKH